MKIGIGLALLLLTACSDQEGGLGWTKPGATYRQFLKDRYACLGISPAPRTPEVFACMKSKGYARTEDGFAAPVGEQAALGD